MGDSRDLPVEPIAPVGGVRQVEAAPTVTPVGGQQPPAKPVRQQQKSDSAQYQAAVSTGSAYTQFVVNDKTNEVVVKIRDAATNEIIVELPAPAVQAMDKDLRDYADLLARRHAAASKAAPKVD